jgi:hypothetical protein
MIRAIRKLISSRGRTLELSQQREKALLRARLIAVAVARATHYSEAR